MKYNKLIAKLGLMAALALSAEAEERGQRPLWMRYPSISPDGTAIAFTYQGDIYKVATTGGQAVRLTTNSAYDTQPVWSPDGQKIAFASDRNRMGMNLYIMNSDGGEAKLLTQHTASKVPYTFTPDGKYLLFKAHIQDDAKSSLYPGSVFSELYRVSVHGGRPERILGTPAEWVAVSADGGRLLYQNVKGYENEWRKHHTSSVTRDIVEYDLKKKTYRFVVQQDGEDRNPVYAPNGQDIYFLSERSGGSMNVYQAALSGGPAKALTHFQDEPVRFLSISRGGTLAFGYGGELYTLTPGERPKRVAVQIQSDLDDEAQVKLSLRAQFGNTAISPDGKQIAFVQRGEVFVTSADYATTKRITNTPAAEQGVTFSADGRALVYASYRDGQWDLYRATMERPEDPNFANATRIKEERLTNYKGEKAYPRYAPDGQEIAFVLDRKKLAVYNINSKAVRILAEQPNLTTPSGGLNYQWSPDSKWIALEYVARGHAPYNDIGIINRNGGQIHNITNSGYFSGGPRWSKDGSALIFITERYGMRNHASWGSMQDVMALFLTRSAYEKYRMSAEELELYEEAEKKSRQTNKGAKAEAAKDSVAQDIQIEWAGLEDRLVRLTPNSADISSAVLSPDGKKLYYMAVYEDKYDLWSLDLKKRTSKLVSKLASPFGALVTTSRGDHIFALGKTAHKLDTKAETLKAVTFAAEMRYLPRAEREAMYNEVVREEALRFYRRDMHGVDWQKLTAHYRRYLPYITNNYDFAEMLSELLGELNVSHTGGRYRSVATPEEPTASLGLFYNDQTGQDGLLIEEVLLGGPCDVSTSKIKAGDVLLAIDGEIIRAGQDYHHLLAGKAGKPTLITYRSSAGEVTERIKPISLGREATLLEKRWVKQRAALVDSLSGGQLGYVHIASMGDDAFRDAYSEVMGRYYNRKGIVIDIRNNGGGRLHEDLEVFFSGEKYLQQEVRGVDYCEMPSRRWNHPSIMLVNENDYSNAHGTPWVYRYKRMGQIVGMPVPGTMTSVNWVTLQDPTLVYGIPAVGYRTEAGTYLENSQLEPDVQIALDPVKALEGEDTQLERAVSELLKTLKLSPR